MIQRTDPTTKNALASYVHNAQVKNSGFHEEQRMSPDIRRGYPEMAPSNRRGIISSLLLKMWMWGLSWPAILDHKDKCHTSVGPSDLEIIVSFFNVLINLLNTFACLHWVVGLCRELWTTLFPLAEMRNHWRSDVIPWRSFSLLTWTELGVGDGSHTTQDGCLHYGSNMKEVCRCAALVCPRGWFVDRFGIA